MTDNVSFSNTSSTAPAPKSSTSTAPAEKQIGFLKQGKSQYPRALIEIPESDKVKLTDNDKIQKLDSYKNTT